MTPRWLTLETSTHKQVLAAAAEETRAPLGNPDFQHVGATTPERPEQTLPEESWFNIVCRPTSLARNSPWLLPQEM